MREEIERRIGGDTLEGGDEQDIVTHYSENNGYWEASSGMLIRHLTADDKYSGVTSLEFNSSTEGIIPKGVTFHFTGAGASPLPEFNIIEFALKVPERNGNRHINVVVGVDGIGTLCGLSFYRSTSPLNVMSYWTYSSLVNSDFSVMPNVWYKFRFVFLSALKVYKIQYYDEATLRYEDITPYVAYFSAATSERPDKIYFSTSNIQTTNIFIDDISFYLTGIKHFSDYLEVVKFTATKKLRYNNIRMIDSVFNSPQLGGFKPWEYNVELILFRSAVTDSVFNQIISFFRNFNTEGNQSPLPITIGPRTYNIFCEQINTTIVGGGKAIRIGLTGREWSLFL